MKPAKFYTVGEVYNNFKITKAIEIEELNCFLRELTHIPTGATVLHINNRDLENLFNLSFRTIPDSSNGVAHILEHTVLCGSEKFPVKDPFFSMGRRSLNTYMNALTGADFTCYPAASQVPTDFYNLLEVYLDAVFHPLLKELSFLQEGHRYEFSEPKNPDSPLTHKGVVFNEMKGALASPSARLSEIMGAVLFPDLPYRFNFGGEPKEIPNLTYRELCAFHQQYYHPSRCLFFFYGSLPLEGHLDFIASKILDHTKPVPQVPALPLQKRFIEPRYFTVDYPIAQEEDLADKTWIAFGWLTCQILEQLDALALTLIDIILMDTDASPLKFALLKSGLCTQVSSGMDPDISEIPYEIVLRGCQENNADKLEKLLFETLEQIVRDGITLEAIENAMHQLEFARSEITGNHSPFGLSLFMRSALLKQHGGQPESGLVIHSLFEELRQKHLENPHYFIELIKKYFLDNKHYVRVTMLPNKDLAAREEAEEKTGLEKHQGQLSAGQIKQIMEKSIELEKYQEKQADEDVDLLPKISIGDVPKYARQIPLTEETYGPFTAYHHGCFTNQIAYVDIVFGLPDLTEQELPIARLFTTFLPQVGWGQRKYTDTLNLVQAHTGGIGSFITQYLLAPSLDQSKPALHIRGKALHRKVPKLFQLFKELLQSADFYDLERLKELILKHYTALNSTLTQGAMKYALMLAGSGLDAPSKFTNMCHGLDYYWTIKKIAENIDNEIKPLAEQLSHMHYRLLGLEECDLVVTSDNDMYNTMKDHSFYGLTDMATKPFIPWRQDMSVPFVDSQGRLIASPIAYIATAFKTIPYVHPDSPALTLAAAIFENLVLHPVVREQGGAYGVGATANNLAGHFTFYSYRDPNISRTIEAFQTAIQTVVQGKFDEEDLEESKLEVFQGLDAPIAPGSRGEVAYSWLKEGKTHEVRQQFRNQLFNVTKADVVESVKRQIQNNFSDAPIIVFAGKELLERENQILAKQNKQLKLFSV